MSPLRETKSVTSGEVRLAVYEAGDPSAPTVLLVHGYPDSHEMWNDVADRLSQRFHVVAYDVRGAGASTAPRSRSGYRLPLLADDAFAVIDAVSPDRPVHLVAHDWGSIQSWETATDPRAVGRISSYTTISGPCLDHIGHWFRRRLSRPTPRALGQLLRQQLKSWYIVAFQIPVLPELLWRTVLGRAFPRLLVRLEKLTPEQAKPARTLRSDGANGVQLYRANMLPRLLSPRERRAEIPVQAIVPTDDRFASPALLDDLHRWVPALWKRTIKASHWVARSHPDAVSRMITQFADHVDGAPAVRELDRARVTTDLFSGKGKRDFTGQLVVITGAGSGIGRATALAFAAQGAEVVVSDLNLAAARETAEQLGQVGRIGYPYRLDVTDESGMDSFAETVLAEHGVPDILVNNAGIGLSGLFADTTLKDWQQILDVNLLGVVRGCQAFAGPMAQRGEGGHIVNLASLAGYQPSKILSAYSTTKAAVLMLSECLRAELAASGIGVSAICPGIVATNITNATRFAGVSEVEQDRLRKRTTKLYRRRNFPPSGVAKEILQAVRRNSAVVPVTTESKAMYALARVSPATLRALAKVDLVPH